MHSNYDSVVEQTGIFAGKGGFDVTVGEHTQLNGAVIGSTAPADNNKLDTGTLGFSDIHNQADYKVEHQSIGISTGGSINQIFDKEKKQKRRYQKENNFISVALLHSKISGHLTKHLF